MKDNNSITKILLVIFILIAAFGVYSAFFGTILNFIGVLASTLLLLVIATFAYSNVPKVLKIFMVIVFLIFVVWSGIFLTDYSKFENGDNPVFANESYKSDREVKYKGLGYEIRYDYSSLGKEQVEAAEIYMFNRLVLAWIK